MLFRMGAVGWIIVLVFIVMILGMIDNMFFNRGAVPTAAVAPGPTALPAVPSGGVTGPSALPASKSSVASAPAPTALPDPAADAARAELSKAAKLLAEAGESADQAVAQIAAWESDVEPLLGNADGQAIAANSDLARQMTFLLKKQRPFKADLTLVSERIKSLQEEIHQLAATDPPGRLKPDKASEVEELHRNSRQARSAWIDAVERARAIAREARRQQPQITAAAPSEPPSAAPTAPSPTSTTPTQPPALASTPQAQSAEPTAVPTTAAPPPASVTPPAPNPATALEPGPLPPKSSTLQDAVERISDQGKIDAVKEEIAKAAERERKENERREAELRLAEQRSIQKAKLVAEARSDAVLRVLQPFLERRSIQPRLAGSSLQWRQTVEQQPMSLSALDNVGALADSVQGLAMLARVGSHRELSSPRWEFSPSPRTWSSDTQDRLKQAQDLLRRLGPTLVEERLLSP